MLIEIISFIIISVVIFIFARLNYKKCETGGEKIIFIFYVIIVIIPVIIYYSDIWNIPTKLKLTKNINSQNWLGFLFTYTSTIVSSIIGVTASIYIAYIQIRKNNEDNEKRDKENLRVQNMPMLKYEIKTTDIDDKKVDINHLIISNCNDQKSLTYDLFISIKNIGLNNVKRIIVDFESSIIKETDRIMGENTIIPIEKNKMMNVYRYIALESGKEYQMKLKVYYEDVLQNWYCQIINILYNATKLNNGSYPLGIVNYKVDEEVLIDSKEVPNG